MWSVRQLPQPTRLRPHRALPYAGRTSSQANLKRARSARHTCLPVGVMVLFVFMLFFVVSIIVRNQIRIVLVVSNLVRHQNGQPRCCFVSSATHK